MYAEITAANSHVYTLDDKSHPEFGVHAETSKKNNVSYSFLSPLIKSSPYPFSLDGVFNS